MAEHPNKVPPVSGEVGELVERLLEVCDVAAPSFEGSSVRILCREAASALTAANADRDRLRETLLSLERYHQFVDGWGDEVLGVKQHPTGDYVKWTDILKLLQAAAIRRGTP